MIEVIFHETGAFDLVLSSIVLKDCFPGIDGRAIRPLTVRVDVRAGRMDYALERGSISLHISGGGEQIVLRMSARGLPAVGVLSPVCAGSLLGADRVFGQGLCMGSSMGLRRLSELEGVKEGYGVAAFGTPGLGYAVLHCDDCTRFLTRFSFTNLSEAPLAYATGFIRECTTRTALASVDYLVEGLAGDIDLPEVIVDSCARLDAGLKAAARSVAGRMHARECSSALFHWCSWYYQYHNFDQQLLEDYTSGFREEGLPFRFIQIDVGYCTTQGDWLKPSHHFPQGLRRAAETIRQMGYEPGIWVGPFMVGDESDLAKEHPDWLLSDMSGMPHVQWRFYGEPKLWGQRDCDYFVLDTSHPEALAYIKSVFATLKAWGYRLFKTDFMAWGLQDSQRVRRFTPGKTGVEYFREALAAIREAIGEDALWLGCIAPFMPFIGFADAMRIGGDVGAQWNDHDFGPVNMIHEIVSDHYFNGIYWRNDPDVVLLRDRHIYLTDEEVESLALLQAMAGGVVATSDPVHLIGQHRRELLDFIRPDHTRSPEILDFEWGGPAPVLVQRVERGALVYIFNPTAEVRHMEVDLTAVMGEGRWFVLEYNGRSLGAASTYAADVARHGGKLLFVSDEELRAQPKNMWRW